MSLALGEQRKCEGCDRRIIGAAKPDDAKVSPINALPTDDGNVLLWRDLEGAPRYAIISHANTRDYLKALGVPLRLNHFADCPKAQQFERGKK